MEVERSKAWHCPHHLWKHTKGYDDAEVGVKCLKLTQEGLIAELLWLQDRQTQLLRRKLHIALVHLLSATCWLIRGGYHSDNVIPLSHQAL